MQSEELPSYTNPVTPSVINSFDVSLLLAIIGIPEATASKKVPGNPSPSQYEGNKSKASELLNTVDTNTLTDKQITFYNVLVKKAK